MRIEIKNIYFMIFQCSAEENLRSFSILNSQFLIKMPYLFSLISFKVSLAISSAAFTLRLPAIRSTISCLLSGLSISISIIVESG
jgi:hypothetical protein